MRKVVFMLAKERVDLHQKAISPKSNVLEAAREYPCPASQREHQILDHDEDKARDADRKPERQKHETPLHPTVKPRGAG